MTDEKNTAAEELEETPAAEEIKEEAQTENVEVESKADKKKSKKQEISNEGQEHLNTFYSYISQIKQFLLKNDMEVEIFRTSKGFYSCSIKD